MATLRVRNIDATWGLRDEVGADRLKACPLVEGETTCGNHAEVEPTIRVIGRA